jgi:hypothetical protein
MGRVEIPGMKRKAATLSGLSNPNLDIWVPDDASFDVGSRLQPYFKLHGSSNWVDAASDGIVVLGGNKSSIINRFPILKWNHDQFSAYLSKPKTRLMVIGYSFGDNHINKLIAYAALAGNLQIFVVDPHGVDVIDKNRDALMRSPDRLAKDLWPHVIGASKRSLGAIFGADRAEHRKVMRFFS